MAGGYPPTNGVLPAADSRAQGEEECCISGSFRVCVPHIHVPVCIVLPSSILHASTCFPNLSTNTVATNAASYFELICTKSKRSNTFHYPKNLIS